MGNTSETPTNYTSPIFKPWKVLPVYVAAWCALVHGMLPSMTLVEVSPAPMGLTALSRRIPAKLLKKGAA